MQDVLWFGLKLNSQFNFGPKIVVILFDEKSIKINNL